MSCYGKTNYNANPDIDSWQILRDKTIELAQGKNDAGFVEYVSGVSDKAWAHIFEENFFTPEQSMNRLWNFYQSDVVEFRNDKK